MLTLLSVNIILQYHHHDTDGTICMHMFTDNSHKCHHSHNCDQQSASMLDIPGNHCDHGHSSCSEHLMQLCINANDSDTHSQPASQNRIPSFMPESIAKTSYSPVLLINTYWQAPLSTPLTSGYRSIIAPRGSPTIYNSLRINTLFAIPYLLS